MRAPTYLKGNLKCLERKEERAVGAVQHAIGAPRGRYALVRRDASQSSWRKHGQHAKVRGSVTLVATSIEQILQSIGYS